MMNKCHAYNDLSLGPSGTETHQLIPYAFVVKDGKKRATSFLCQQCLCVLHLNEINDWHEQNKRKGIIDAG